MAHRRTPNVFMLTLAALAVLPVARAGDLPPARVQSDAAWYRAITGTHPPKHRLQRQ